MCQPLKIIQKYFSQYKALRIGQMAVHYFYSTPRPWGGWDFHEPTQNLVDEFEAGDPRRGYSLLQPGDIVDRGSQGMTEFTPDLTNTGFSSFTSIPTSELTVRLMEIKMYPFFELQMFI